MSLVKIDRNLLKRISNLLFIFVGAISIFLIVQYINYINFEKQKNLLKFINNISFKKTQKIIINSLKSNYKEISHNIKPGENLNKILKNYGIKSKEINILINEIKKYTNLNSLKVGQEISLIINQEDKGRLEKIVLPITNTIILNIERNIKDELTTEKIVTKLFKKEILAEGIIKNNLYAASIAKDVPPNIIIEFARIYGFEIDFQREIRKNDTFQILYEIFVDENEDYHKAGKIIYTNMNVQNKEISLYRFNHKKSEGYYNINGKSVEKALMKTPINGARLSSSYGLRKHPILGFNKMHRGTDFAAATGTPIMASGTGKIIKAGWCGGGGNCIKIKHNSTYSTVYAHLSKFHKRTKVGKKVKQGSIIGYVGSTGLSTGPHLHYEVHVNGKAVNSQKLNLPSGKILKDKERKLFEIQRIKIDILLSKIIESK